jgi:hypothetical protein
MTETGSPLANVAEFTRQNPASKKLMEEVGKVLDEVLDSLTKEIKEFLETVDQE